MPSTGSACLYGLIPRFSWTPRAPTLPWTTTQVRGLRRRAGANPPKAEQSAPKRAPRALDFLDPPRRKVKEPQDSGIREYEQEFGKPDTREAVPNVFDPAHPAYPHAKALEDKVEQMKKDLKQRPVEADRKVQEFGNKLFTEEQKDQFRNALEANLDKYMGIPHQVMIDEDASGHAQLFVYKLNLALNDTSLKPDSPRLRKNLWFAYQRCKIYVPDLAKHLPDAAWELLWLSQAENNKWNSSINEHLTILTEDMKAAGKVLNDFQKFESIQGLYYSGRREEALAQWEAGLKAGDGGKVQYLELGIRLHSTSEQLDRAEELAEVLFTLHPDADPRTLFDIILAFINRQDDSSMDRAWAVYQLFRKKAKENVKIEDFDQVSMAFLQADRSEHALAVFRDMMLAGEARESSQAKGMLSRIASFANLSKSADEVSKLHLESLHALPRRYQNKFFYASWMKRLIGMGKLPAAIQVLALMYERGVSADAKHVNGILGALVRNGSRSSHKNVESLGWAMVQQRLDLVRKRENKNSSEQRAPVSVYSVKEGISSPDDEVSIPDQVAAVQVPPATIETFSIMAQYFLRRSKFANVRHLRQLMDHCGIAMNSYFMNHLLYAEVRNRTYRDAWSRFQTLTKTVKPDLDTFRCLWACMKIHVDPATNTQPEGFPNPRELLVITRNWLSSLSGQALGDVHKDISQELYDEIVRCFCLSRDPAGTFVAMYWLRAEFALFPTKDTMQLLVFQIARLTSSLPTNRWETRTLSASKELQENIKTTSDALDTIGEFRQEGYKEAGIDFAALGQELKNEEQLRTVWQLLFTALETTGEEDEIDVAVPLIAAAAEAMGIDDMDVDGCLQLVQ